MRFTAKFLEDVRADLEAGNIVFLAGEPGIGKSSWVRDLARLMRTQCFTVRCNQLADKADLTGCRLVPYTRDDGTQSYMQVFYPHAEIMRCVDYANAHPDETPILFLDEINRTNSDVTSELLSIPTDRAIGDTTLPDNIIVLCAGNDKGNVVTLDDASITRFTVYKMNPDVTTYLSLDPDLNPYVRSTLEKNPSFLVGKTLVADDADTTDASIEDVFGSDDQMIQLTCPRTITSLSRWLNKYDDAGLRLMLAESDTIDGEDVNLLQEHIEAHVGRTPFSLALLKEISTALASGSQVNSATPQIIKPSCFAALEQAPTIADLEGLVDSMSDHERSGCLVYALYDASVTRQIVTMLAQKTAHMEQDDTKTLFQLASFDKLASPNVRDFLSSNSPLAASLAVVLETTLD